MTSYNDFNGLKTALNYKRNDPLSPLHEDLMGVVAFSFHPILVNMMHVTGAGFFSYYLHVGCLLSAQAIMRGFALSRYFNLDLNVYQFTIASRMTADIQLT